MMKIPQSRYALSYTPLRPLAGLAIIESSELSTPDLKPRFTGPLGLANICKPTNVKDLKPIIEIVTQQPSKISACLAGYSETQKAEILHSCLNSNSPSDLSFGAMTAGSLLDKNEEEKIRYLNSCYQKLTDFPKERAQVINITGKTVINEEQRTALLQKFAEFEREKPLRRLLLIKVNNLKHNGNKLELLSSFLLDSDSSTAFTAQIYLKNIYQNVVETLSKNHLSASEREDYTAYRDRIHGIKDELDSLAPFQESFMKIQSLFDQTQSLLRKDPAEADNFKKTLGNQVTRLRNGISKHLKLNRKQHKKTSSFVSHYFNLLNHSTHQMCERLGLPPLKQEKK